MKVVAHKCRNIEHPFPIAAWLIMIFQGMKPWDSDSYSHMAISAEDDNEHLFWDANFTGVQKRNREKFFETYELIESIELDVDMTMGEFKAWASCYEGRRYSFIQLIGLLAKHFGLVKSNPIGRNLDRLICSELLLAFKVDNMNLKVKDTDDFDLISTWKIIKGEK